MRYGSRLLVDLDVLESNYKKLKKICLHNEVLFMVKADAYGHGLLPIVQFTHQELGIREFGCATLGEARALREAFPNDKFDVYVFSDLDLKEGMESYLNKRILPVLSNFEDLDFFLGQDDFENFPLCLKINTGMNRLGFHSDSIDELIAKIKKSGRKSIYHFMSHFSNASRSMDTDSQNISQREKFKDIKSSLESSGLAIERSSMANSGSIEQGHMLDESHVRPGLMLYGPSSMDRDTLGLSNWDGEIISQLETKVLVTSQVSKGDLVGYGATASPRDGKLAIIPLGYGDGLSTRFQNAMIKNDSIEGEILGRVNMDMTQILLPVDSKVSRGDEIYVWTHDRVAYQEFCFSVGMIPYEIFCQLTPRLPRVYSRGGQS